MTHSAKISIAVFSGLLLACGAALWLTRDTATTKQTTAIADDIDHRLYDAARQLAGIAETPQEQELAREAARLADHELDQAYATAVREAAAQRPQTKGPLAALHARIDQATTRIAAGKERIAKLPKDNTAQIELAQAQLALDEDELEDAEADLAREGGDPRAALERARAEHQAAQHDVAPVRPSPPAPTGTAAQQWLAWLGLGDHEAQVESAREQASARGAALAREHASLEALIAQKPVPAPDPDQDQEDEDSAAMVARLRSLSDQRKTLTELDRRIQDCNQMAETYRSWGSVIATRRRAVLRLLLHSLSLIFGVLLVAVLVETGAHRALRKTGDRHRAHQHRFLTTVAVRFVGAALIALIVFGPPSQTPTIIGLATAGLTVVLKDFVVAFIGWFVLMGRNGVRIGDWVEIGGVGGEVIEIGLFKTVLLEMGNWSTAGHPTGRRVSFMNGYAFEGHWFNFSTAGQWLWDELQVSVPPGADAYATVQRIREVVERETESSAQLAEQDWERITKQYGTRSFSARPAVDLRPGLQGLEVHVRYIVRGPERFEVKSRIFKEIVELLRQ